MLFDEHAAAAELNVSVRTLQKWRCSGAGPRFRKLNRSVRYHPDDLAAFVMAGVRTSTSDAGREAA